MMQFNQVCDAIMAADDDIKSALRRGDMDRAMVLISRKVGWRVCVGDIVVKLKKQKYA